MSMDCHCAPHGAGGCRCGTGREDDRTTHVEVTVNPEARVSVARTRIEIPPIIEETLTLSVGITNEGMVTATLEASLVGDTPAGAALDFAHELSGEARDATTVHVRIPGACVADITVAFRLSKEAPELGGRDRVSLLARSAPRVADALDSTIGLRRGMPTRQPGGAHPLSTR